MALEFTVCEVRWERYPKVSENTHAREWLEFQAARGLAANTLDAYGRNLDAYLGFLASKGIPLDGVVRSTVGLYIRAIADLPVPKVLKGGRREARATLANATLQQHLTVVRLFHDYLVEQNVCTRNPLRPPTGGRSLIQRHHRLPWIPSEEEWQNILQASRQECLRNRVMLAMSYDAALRREEICSLETSDIDPAQRLLRIRSEITKNRRERIVPYSVPTSELVRHKCRSVCGVKRGKLHCRATRATTFDHVEIEIGFPLFRHDSDKNKAPRSRLSFRRSDRYWLNRSGASELGYP